MPQPRNTVSKSSRKRRKASINFVPKSSKKRAISSTKNSDNNVESDFMDDKVKDNRIHGKNEESSELSSQEEQEESDQINNNQQDAQLSIAGNKNTPTIPQEISSKVGKESNIGNEGGLQAQTDKHFIQQQVQLLTTAFTLQDCPGLAGKRKRKDAIPQDVVNDALRKLHHKMDDEIQKHLNRQCQRKVLSELQEIEKDTTLYENEGQSQGESYIADTMSVSEILEKCSKDVNNDEETDSDLLRQYVNSKTELQKLHDGVKKMKQEIASYESNNLMVLEVKHLASETTEQSLKKEVERTKKLVSQVTSLLRRKVDMD